ncbi:MAG: tRNA pseudouridine(55) synthase TruB [Deinococcales bacterium]|nr:tRNA pseudouridine(55) synthase TruB [Chitinophagaceae bacterium]
MQVLTEFSEGKVLLFDKPLTWTSFNVVSKVRYLTKVKKVGHAGTLDPLATGLLIVCTGKFTKKINEYMGMPKEYIGTITLGSITPSFDLETNPENFKDTAHLTEQAIIAATEQFKGAILQMPPQHSAIKKDGKRLYESARLGILVEVAARPVTIYAFDIVKIVMPVVHFRVACSTGTYIRSLANDFGAALGVGGYMSSLCRTKIGDFDVADAISVPDFIEDIQQLRANMASE